MLPRQSPRAFTDLLARRQRRVEQLTVPEGIDLMLDFYRDVRADGCDLAGDGDMVLYQYGTFDWGAGRHFEIDLTRQFILAGGEDEDIWQLSLTFYFAPTPALAAVGRAHRWYASPDQIDEARSFIRNTPAFAATLDLPILRVDLRYECAG